MSEIKGKEPAPSGNGASSTSQQGDNSLAQDYHTAFLRKSQEATLEKLKKIREDMLCTYGNLDEVGQIAWDMGEQFNAVCDLIGQLEVSVNET